MRSFKSVMHIILFASILLAGCSALRMNVKSQSAPKKDLHQLKSFGIALINSDDPEIEKEILGIVREKLEAKGFTFINSDPDFLVAVHFYVGVYEEYVPPKELNIRNFEGGPQERRSRDLIRDTAFRNNGTNKSSHKLAGYVDTGFYQNIQVYFVHLLDKQTVEITWQAEVDSRNKNNDILAVAPYMLKELMGEFPDKTNKPQKRKVKMN